MAKVECLALAGQKCGFANVGEIEFDEKGFAEIQDAELLAALSQQNGFVIHQEELKAPKKPKTPKAPEAEVKESVEKEPEDKEPEDKEPETEPKSE